MADAQANVTVNINADTGDLDAKLAKQEAAIKTLDGAINVLGGSVELAASALIATGVASEETAKEFEATALAAIAFADGSKRVLDGVKSLNEGLKAYGGVSQIATKATTFLNNAIKANPAVAIATGIAVLTGAIVAYISATDDATEAEINRLESIEDTLEAQNRQLSREEKLAKARGATIEELAEIRKQQLLNRLEIIKTQRQALQADGVVKNAEEINKLGEEYFDIQNDIKILAEETARAVEARQEKEKEAAEKAANAVEKVKEEYIELPPYINAVKDEIDTLIEVMGGLEAVVTGPVKKAFDDFNTNMETSMRLTYDFKNATKETTVEIPPLWLQYLNLISEYNKTFVKGQVEFFKSDLGQAIGAGLQSAVTLARTVRETIDETTEEGFEKGKKARIAETRIASIQAAFSAYGGVVGVPIVGAVLAPLAAAAALVAGQKAINDIKASSFNDQSAPSNPVSSAASFGGGAIPGTSSQGGFLALAPPTTSTPPVRAYVVTGDVTNGIEAEQQLQTRRQFGPG